MADPRTVANDTVARKFYTTVEVKDGSWIQVDGDQPGIYFYLPDGTTYMHGIYMDSGEPTVVKCDGKLRVGSDPVAALDVATKQYVDGKQRQVQTTSFGNLTLAASNENALLLFYNAGAATLTLPSNLTTVIDIGARFDVARMAAGTVTLVADTGVTITATPGLALRATGSAVSLIKVNNQAWLATGDLS